MFFSPKTPWEFNRYRCRFLTLNPAGHGRREFTPHTSIYFIILDFTLFNQTLQAIQLYHELQISLWWLLWIRSSCCKIGRRRWTMGIFLYISIEFNTKKPCGKAFQCRNEVTLGYIEWIYAKEWWLMTIGSYRSGKVRLRYSSTYLLGQRTFDHGSISAKQCKRNDHCNL